MLPKVCVAVLFLAVVGCFELLVLVCFVIGFLFSFRFAVVLLVFVFGLSCVSSSNQKVLFCL